MKIQVDCGSDSVTQMPVSPYRYPVKFLPTDSSSIQYTQTEKTQRLSYKYSEDYRQKDKLHTSINKDLLFQNMESFEIMSDDEIPLISKSLNNDRILKVTQRRKINQSFILNKIENSHRKQFPSFRLKNYLSEQNAKNYLEQVENKLSLSILPENYDKLIQKIKNDIITNKSKSKQFVTEIQQSRYMQLPKIKIRRRAQHISNSGGHEKNNLDGLNDSYDFDENFQTKNIEFKQKNKPMVQTELTIKTTERANQVLQEYYQIKYLENKLPEIRLEMGDPRLMLDQHKFQSYQVSPRTLNTRRSQTSLKKVRLNIDIFTKKTHQLVQRINIMDKSLGKQIKRTKLLEERNKYETLQKQIEKIQNSLKGYRDKEPDQINNSTY